MSLVLDHLVHAVPDLDTATATFAGMWGLHVVRGGSHPLWGTQNSLCHLGLPYVEFITVHDPQRAQESDFGRSVLAQTALGGGLSTFALGTRDINAAVARLRQAGVEVEGPVDGRRERPDGSMLSWRLAFPAAVDGLPMPFLIKWELDEAQRTADLAARGIAGQHRHGDLRLGAVTVSVRSLGAAVAAYREYYGLQAGPAYDDAELGGRCARIELGRGGIVLCEPMDTGPAAARLMQSGEGPFLMEVRGSEAPAMQQMLASRYPVEPAASPSTLLAAHGAIWRLLEP